MTDSVSMLSKESIEIQEKEFDYTRIIDVIMFDAKFIYSIHLWTCYDIFSDYHVDTENKRHRLFDEVS